MQKAMSEKGHINCKIRKSILMMLILAKTFLAATYLWMVHSVLGCVETMQFVFLGYSCHALASSDNNAWKYVADNKFSAKCSMLPYAYL